MILERLRLELFSEVLDEIIEKITFDNTNYSIRLLYEQKFYDFSKTKQETELRRIDIKKGNYYNPDYIIEIFDKIKQKKKYYILDAKYSKLHTVRSNHLPDVIEKYIINTGINESPNTKVNSLNLIFPNEFGQKIIESDYFEPTIELTASKPNFENELKLFINRILEQNISENLIIK